MLIVIVLLFDKATLNDNVVYGPTVLKKENKNVSKIKKKKQRKFQYSLKKIFTAM